jgi:hypothetical protein
MEIINTPLEKFFTLTYKGETLPENKAFEITGEEGYYWAALLSFQRTYFKRPEAAKLRPEDWYRLRLLLEAKASNDVISADGAIRFNNVPFYQDSNVAEGVIAFE